LATGNRFLIALHQGGGFTVVLTVTMTEHPLGFQGFD
jgi:hypothetical protein